jgi:hypothetical protein
VLLFSTCYCFLFFFHFAFWSRLLFLSRFGGRQVQAIEDDGSVNHASVRDLEADAVRLEQFGAELEAE